MKKIFFLLTALSIVVAALPARAHFGMVLPSEQVVMDSKKNTLAIDLKFWHPFENTGMNLDKPKSFRVIHLGKSTDLLPALKERKEQGKSVWGGAYTLSRPGLYAFVMEPQPYWEKEEDCFIIHHSKAYVAAFGDDEGWAEPLGLKTEIVPLAKPYGLYAGNSFQGQVLLDGKPVPGAEVEVEWYPGLKLAGQAPNDMMVTQTVKADGAGIFTYVMPWAGWWGFAALNTSPETMPHEGQQKKVELGAVLWLRAHEAQKAQPLKK